jgi:hypothetical protein
MPADQPRTRTVDCKMTDSEYERLSAVAEGDGMTLGEWVREAGWRTLGASIPLGRPILVGCARTGSSALCFPLSRWDPRLIVGIETEAAMDNPSHAVCRNHLTTGIPV